MLVEKITDLLKNTPFMDGHYLTTDLESQLWIPETDYRIALVSLMNKKTKKKPNKKDKQKTQDKLDNQSIRTLKQKIKKLEKELNSRENLIEELRSQLKKSKPGKGKKNKPIKNAPKSLFAGQTNRVGVVQRKAWQRHGYLRDRYEFHLANGQDKNNARVLADKDLRDKYGEGAGYTEQELEQILS